MKRQIWTRLSFEVPKVKEWAKIGLLGFVNLENCVLEVLTCRRLMMYLQVAPKMNDICVLKVLYL